MTGGVEGGRGAFERQAWAEAFELLGAEAADGHLTADDLERLAIAAYLIGKDDDSAQAWERAHLECLRAGDPAQAARCAFWLGLALLLRGEMAQAGGWLGRASRLVEEGELDCVARGYLLVPAFIEVLEGGDAATADRLATQVADLAERFGDADLLALGRLCRAQASIALGATGRGVGLLDELMVSVTTGEVSPVLAGIIYCAVIEECIAAFDLRRAAEWTEALTSWCEAQPDLMPYRGQCLVHRSQLLQVHGEWARAVSEVERARRHLSSPPHPALGIAHYQHGELERLGGELVAAEAAYRAASQHGFEPMPGLALLRLAQGDIDGAAATIRRAVGESHGPATRCNMLAACVEIMVAKGDVGAAREAADELLKLAADIDAPLLHASADHAAGTVLLAEGEPASALTALRRASAHWRTLEMPYEAARTRVLTGLACRALGDDVTADLELDAARIEFERLGATRDAAHTVELSGGDRPAATAVLTERECEVLRLVAAGRTNREIGAQLVISEHTVARHLQNIFTKVGLSSRAAATAYAYEHGLV